MAIARLVRWYRDEFLKVREASKVIRLENPNGILFANLGAHYDAESVNRLSNSSETNAIQIHVNRAENS